MDKIFKNPTIMGIISVLTLVVILAYIWDEKKNPSKDFFGLLKPKTTV